MRVAHVISSLGVGGAENMLVSLTEALASRGWESHVVSLTDEGVLASELRVRGATVSALGMRSGVPNPVAIPRLASAMRSYRPDVIQTWMYHANLIGGGAALLAGGIPLVWSLHSANAGLIGAKAMTRWTSATCARLSRYLPKAIVCCSEETRRIHERLGYAAELMEVIPNGFDTRRFVPDRVARDTIRAELGVGPEAVLIGMPARYDPQKDHDNFAEAARIFSARTPSAHFVLCGVGIEWRNHELVQAFRGRGLKGNLHLLGVRRDMPAIYAAMDLVTTSSFSEAFPMVLGEAMSCGTPCVATDVGDSAVIIGDAGRVVPPRDAVALAGAWSTLIGLSTEQRSALSKNARERVVSRFSLPHVTARYASIYGAVASRPSNTTKG